MEADAAYPSEHLRQCREALREADAANDAEFATKVKEHFEKLARRIKEQADNYHEEPPEEENTLKDLRRELHGVYEDLRSVVEKLFGLAFTVLKNPHDLRRAGNADALLKSFLDDVYGDADLYLSAAVRIAAQYRVVERKAVIQADSAVALARGARDAANAYLHFAETFGAMVETISDVVSMVMQAQAKANRGPAR